MKNTAIKYAAYLRENVRQGGKLLTPQEYESFKKIVLYNLTSLVWQK